jgi:hypothetical protein
LITLAIVAATVVATGCSSVTAAITTADSEAATRQAKGSVNLTQLAAYEAIATARADDPRVQAREWEGRRDAAALWVSSCADADTIASNTKSLPDAVMTSQSERSDQPVRTCLSTREATTQAKSTASADRLATVQAGNTATVEAYATASAAYGTASAAHATATQITRAIAAAERVAVQAWQQRRDEAASFVSTCSAAATIASNTNSVTEALATAQATRSARPARTCRGIPPPSASPTPTPEAS